MIERRYQYRNQRLSPFEEGILHLAYVKYTDRIIARWLGRPTDTIRKHRELRGLMKNRRRAITLAAVCCLISLAVAAHDDSDDFASWYRSLHGENDISCCAHNRDCKAVDVYQGTPDGYEVLYDGAWVVVPWKAVIQRSDNPTGHAVLCVGYLSGKPVARCFVRAAEG